MNKKNGEFCEIKIGGVLNAYSLESTDSAEKEEEGRYSFALTKDPDGEEHFGVRLSEEEINNRINIMREFWQEGMIPWICPSCGKLWGANYDVGSLQWFECNFCGAEWELANGDDVDKYVDQEKRKQKIHVVQ